MTGKLSVVQELQKIDARIKVLINKEGGVDHLDKKDLAELFALQRKMKDAAKYWPVEFKIIQKRMLEP